MFQEFVNLIAGLAVIVTGVFCKAPPENLLVPQDVTLFISADPTTISINGGVSTITVTIFDKDGNLIEDGRKLFFTTTLGSIESEVFTSGGTAIARLRSTGEPGVANVTAIANIAAPPPAPTARSSVNGELLTPRTAGKFCVEIKGALLT